jgi:stearoyl-CoA desaturase (delta-9 desaturase)
MVYLYDKYNMIIISLLVMTHITILAVTVFLHRSQAHKSVELHPILSHFFRFWLWLTTGMVTKQWVAIHRKHHRFTDESEDPHSPKVYGIMRVLFKGAFLYNNASKDQKMVLQYGVGTPDDWLERKLYSPHSRLGILLMLVIDLVLFGPWGLIVWGIQMIWIPFWAAGVVNGIGHWWGYRNGQTKDLPIGFVIGGEELHNNHHLEPASAKLSRRWFEVDIGWWYIKLFKFLHLAKIRNV